MNELDSMVSVCPICDGQFSFSSECFETDDGDLCPACTAEMRVEDEQEITLQAEGMSEQAAWSAFIAREQIAAVATALQAAGYAVTNAGCHGYVINVARQLEPGDASARHSVIGIIMQAIEADAHSAEDGQPEVTNRRRNPGFHKAGGVIFIEEYPVAESADEFKAALQQLRELGVGMGWLSTWELLTEQEQEEADALTTDTYTCPYCNNNLNDPAIFRDKIFDGHDAQGAFRVTRVVCSCGAVFRLTEHDDVFKLEDW